MRSLLGLLLVLAFSLQAHSQQLFLQDSLGYVSEAEGVVVNATPKSKNAVWVIKSGPSVFYPTFVPEGYQSDNLPITFSGVVGTLKEGLHTWGTPLELREIAHSRQGVDFDSVGMMENFNATVTFRNGRIYLESQSGNAITIFQPLNLSPDLVSEGEKIRFTAIRGLMRPGDIGIPIRIKSIIKENPNPPVIDTRPALSHGADSTGYLENVPGQVVKLNDELWMIEVDDDGRTVRYAPENWPPEMQIEGLNILFDAILRRVPDGVKLAGYPVRLVNIKKL